MICNPAIFKSGNAATTTLKIDGTKGNGSCTISSDSSESGEYIVWNKGDIIEREVPVGTLVLGFAYDATKSGDFHYIKYKISGTNYVTALSVVKDVVITRN